ncbi:MAG: CoA transferase, partial [Dehalococcoidia bacterium]|nr:CoA transferase [Dehalococcoidia bacterium]
RFKTHVERRENIAELMAILKPIFAARSVDEWMGILSTADVMVSPVNKYADLASDPQVIANGYIIDWDHPTLGQIKFPGFPIEYSETPWRISRPAPELGEHTEEILVDLLGYSWAEVESLRDEGII